MKLKVLIFAVVLAAAVDSAVPPRTFDAREEWLLCPSIGTVPNQGCCAASYAIAPTSVMADRTCIETNATNQLSYSSQQVLQCCPNCALASGKNCVGGDPEKVWNLWTTVGIASGGAFGTGIGCVPYTFAFTCLSLMCPPACIPGYPKKTVIEDLSRGKEYYKIDHPVIMSEIMTYGPVSTSIDLYSDFLTYKGGVYVSEKRRPFLGRHHVKLIGWGTENGTDYWLAVNSFGTSWGEQGLFKILRGHNHLGVETRVIAGHFKSE